MLVFPPTDDEDKYWVLPYFWVPEDTLDLRVKRDHVPYDVWERQGFIMTTEGNLLRFHLCDGSTQEYIWRDRSRAESWTPEMKKAAALATARRYQNGRKENNQD